MKSLLLTVATGLALLCGPTHAASCSSDNSLASSSDTTHSNDSQVKLKFSCPQICASIEKSNFDLINGINRLVRPKVFSTCPYNPSNPDQSQITDYIQKHPHLTMFPAPGQEDEFILMFPSRAIVKARKSDGKIIKPDSATFAALIGQPHPFAHTTQEIKHAIYKQTRISTTSSVTNPQRHRLKKSIKLGNLLRPEFNAMITAAAIENGMHTDHPILKECIPSGASVATLQDYKKYKIKQMYQKLRLYDQKNRMRSIRRPSDPTENALFDLVFDSSDTTLCNTEQEELDALKRIKLEVLKEQDDLLTHLQTHCPNEMGAVIAAIAKTLDATKPAPALPAPTPPTSSCIIA